MKPSVRNILIPSAVTLAIALGALVRTQSSAATDPSPSSAEAGAKQVLTVARAVVQQRTWPVELACSGATVSWQDAVIGAEVDGLRITALHVDVGSRVQRGQVLAELARDAVEAELHRYEAALASAKASLLHAQADAERARALANSGVMSQQQINQYLTAELTARAAVDLADAQVKEQQVTLNHTFVRAVDDGVITSRTALLGQVVSTGDELYRLQRQGKVEWRAEVDAKQLALIEPGAAAAIVLADGKRIEGKVRLVSPTLSDTTARANVFVALPAGITAGDFLSGHIRAGEQALLTVPLSAIVLRDGYSYVFELTGENTVVRRQVQLGPQRGLEVAVMSGIAEHTNVVASGGAFLTEGDKVKVVGEQI